LAAHHEDPSEGEAAQEDEGGHEGGGPQVQPVLEQLEEEWQEQACADHEGPEQGGEASTHDQVQPLGARGTLGAQADEDEDQEHDFGADGPEVPPRDSGRDTLQWVREAQQRGAGEIVLNCMNVDGVRQGFDIAQLKAVRAICRVPLIASGGAGAVAHFIDVFEQADVDGALAASVFHSGEIAIPQLKADLRAAGIEVRIEA